MIYLQKDHIEQSGTVCFESDILKFLYQGPLFFLSAF